MVHNNRFKYNLHVFIFEIYIQGNNFVYILFLGKEINIVVYKLIIFGFIIKIDDIKLMGICESCYLK